MSDLRDFVTSTRQALDEIDRRLADIERRPLPAVSMRENIEQRRRLVARARSEGLSIERIVRATGIPRTTVLRDLDATDHRVPDRVLGVDDRRHPATHAWGRRTDAA